MTMFRKNMEAIKTRPYLLEKLNELKKKNVSSNDLYEFSLLDTKEDTKSLFMRYNNHDYRINSSYYPTEEAKIWAEQFNFSDLCVYISMFGLGNGIFVREIIKKLRTDDRIFIYEPSMDIFIYVLNNYDITDILNNPKVILAIENVNEYEFHAQLRDNVNWMNVHYQMLCIHPLFDDIFINSYKKFLEELKNNNNQAIINRNTTAYFGKMSIQNTIHNLKYLFESNLDMDFYDDIPKDIPAIIVSAGPSLSKNLSYLKAAKGKSVIIAVDRALNYLLKHDIEPDFIITLDSSKPIEYFSDRKDISIPLFCTLDASKSIMEAHKGKKIWFALSGFASYIFYELKKRVSNLNSGGCVATGAFSVCVGLGFETIILVGQDLAFSADKATHADGIVGDGDTLKNVLTLIEGVDGNLVETRHDWYSYLIWFQDAIKDFPNINVIDATEGGAKILGSSIMRLEDAIEKYCIKEFDCKKMLNSINPTFTKEDVNRFSSILKDAIKNLDEIIEKGNEATKCCRKLILESNKNTIGSVSSQKLVNQISVINDTVMKYPVFQLIDSDISIVAIENLSSIYKLTGDATKDQIITYQRAEKLYSAIVASAKTIKPLLVEILPNFYEFIEVTVDDTGVEC